MTKNIILDRINVFLAFRGLSKKDMAVDIDFSYNTIQNYFLRGSQPSMDFITRICDTYGVNANWLLLGKGDMLYMPQEAKSKALDEEEIDRQHLRKVTEAVDNALKTLGIDTADSASYCLLVMRYYLYEGSKNLSPKKLEYLVEFELKTHGRIV